MAVSQQLTLAFQALVGAGIAKELVDILGGTEEGAHSATGYTATTDGVTVTAGGITVVSGGITITGATSINTSLALLSGADISMSDSGSHITLGTVAGTKIGTDVTQKLGFWNATPVVQPASGDQADQGTMTTVGANTGTSGAGLSLIGNTSTVDQSAALMNDLLALQEDIAALDTLVTSIRTALVNTGIIKGSA